MALPTVAELMSPLAPFRRERRLSAPEGTGVPQPRPEPPHSCQHSPALPIRTSYLQSPASPQVGELPQPLPTRPDQPPTSPHGCQHSPALPIRPSYLQSPASPQACERAQPLPTRPDQPPTSPRGNLHSQALPTRSTRRSEPQS
jgi:hypothetical protein